MRTKIFYFSAVRERSSQPCLRHPRVAGGFGGYCEYGSRAAGAEKITQRWSKTAIFASKCVLALLLTAQKA